MKAFNTFSAAMLGIGSMVGAGIFIVIGEAGSIAGNILWLSFVFGGIASLLSGYSLAKLAIRFPSRGGIIEYITQEYGENFFSGGLSIMFYFSQIISIAAVSKSFGEYGARLFGFDLCFVSNLFALGIVFVFAFINFIGASVVAKSENIIVAVKLSILILFTLTALFYINPQNFALKNIPSFANMFFAIGLTFFAYQGFSVITNTIEDMENPKKTVLKSMFIAILTVMILYIATSIAVLGNLGLDEIIKAKDYALAEAAKPVFGSLGFKIMALTALIATASAINATLYSATEISYTLAKKGELPKFHTYNTFSSKEGLIISTLLIIPLILFFNLGEITTIAALGILIIQGFVHFGHLLIIKKTGADKITVSGAAVSMFAIAALTVIYNSKKDPQTVYYLAASFLICFILEYALRIFSKRTVKKQIKNITNEFLK